MRTMTHQALTAGSPSPLSLDASMFADRETPGTRTRSELFSYVFFAGLIATTFLI